MTDSFRPQYHFTAPDGWINDPNGLVFFEGEYHLFYQYRWPRHWGHAVGTDLVHWRHLPAALTPDFLGDIWSGSAIVDRQNTSGLFDSGGGLLAFFTHQKEGLQRQSLAFSADRGRTWQMHPGNPILPNPGLADFRDPKVLWHEPTDQWIMLVATGDHISFYSSTHLLEWTLAGKFGQGWGHPGMIWECPDLFELPIDGHPAQRKWILQTSYLDSGIFKPPNSPGRSGVHYFIGHFDGTTFHPEQPRESVRQTSYGPDDYGTITWFNLPHRDHAIGIGWMNNWVYASKIPTTPWQGAMTLPRQFGLRTTADGLRLWQRPVEALSTLRAEVVNIAGHSIVDGEFLLPDVHGDTLELLAEFGSSDAAECGIAVRRGGLHATRIGYDRRAQAFFIDRTHAGEAAFSPYFARRYTAPFRIDGKPIRLRVFVDRSSVELFAGDGAVYLACQVFPSPQAQGVSVFAHHGAAQLTRLEAYRLKPATSSTA